MLKKIYFRKPNILDKYQGPRRIITENTAIILGTAARVCS